MRWPHTVLNTQNSLFFYVYPLNFFCKCSFHVWGGGFLQPPYTIKSSGRVQQFCSGIQKLLRTLFWQGRSNLSVRLCRSEISMFILQGGNIILGTVRLVKAWLPLFFFLPPPAAVSLPFFQVLTIPRDDAPNPVCALRSWRVGALRQMCLQRGWKQMALFSRISVLK